MKRIVLGWRTPPTDAPFRPLEALSWNLGSNNLVAAQSTCRKAEAEECTYVGEGEGLGTSFSTIAEALAFAEYEGDTVVNREAAIEEQARRRGWSKRGA